MDIAGRGNPERAPKMLGNCKTFYIIRMYA